MDRLSALDSSFLRAETPAAHMHVGWVSCLRPPEGAHALTVSNVPGPGAPLFAAGAMVEDIYPVIPLADEHLLSIGVLSYRERLHFSLYADPNALSEIADSAT